mgnify:CR=1 FL=1
MASDANLKQHALDNIARAQNKTSQVNQPPTPTANPTPAPTGPTTQPATNPAPASGNSAERARTKYEEGVALIGQRQYQQAVDALGEALSANPGFAQALTARGSARVGLRQYQEAAQDYLDALKLDPSMATPLFGAAEAYRAMGRKRDAASYYEKYAASAAPDVNPQLQSEARAQAAALTR